MKLLITGGAGFIGRRLASTLLERGAIDAGGGREPIEEIVLFDVVRPEEVPDDPRVRVVTGDIGEEEGGVVDKVGFDVGAVFHLAAVVSGAAEADFDLGAKANLVGTQQIIELCRHISPKPRVVFASSVAAYGGELPEVIDDGVRTTPQTSYGVQKVIGELLLGDATRKGFLDARCLRLPTIVVRPGKPNKAASSFASAVIREPLAGEDVVCPVPPETGVFVLSPERVVDALIRAFELPADALGWDRTLQLPGLTVTVAAMLEALAEVAGREVADRVRFEPDPVIADIVETWPVRFRTPRAEALGFAADPDIRSVIEAHIRDEHGGRAPG